MSNDGRHQKSGKDPLAWIGSSETGKSTSGDPAQLEALLKERDTKIASLSEKIAALEVSMAKLEERVGEVVSHVTNRLHDVEQQAASKEKKGVFGGLFGGGKE